MTAFQKSFSPVSARLLKNSEVKGLRWVPDHLLTDCGFESAANFRSLDLEINRSIIQLTGLR